ncbi:McrC family protein [Pseudomonas lijiangensis]|uniref:McrC family protein n=1 Tax=Pseudomonas lijiangensis TaxID=2995658 RepID=A0ABX8HPK7_9PSED|nr:MULTISPECIES: McrC family protein [Pseudomonas syringae group]MBX8499872.1 McrC family protein [Pseudomonas lijiangensis]MBX8503631.1 McrC family protein [Pseudomonas lijiangensis]MBX8533358.1 McrC family protein [Pseudomonas cichorii]MBX8617036.1 McrC family protein [Pseudomonas cichorii]QWU81963.1 McrC family protein [Pseudomonas lijiangensis]
MKTTLTVREYARLTTSHVLNPSLDRAQVSASAFDWLCEQSSKFSKVGAALVQIEDRRWLKLDNYVGVLETPCGTRIEILPKHFDKGDCIQQSRALLRRMIQKSLNLPTREVGVTALQRFDAPLTEWVMGSFLETLDHLIKRGLRFDYQRVEEEQRYLRGQLNTARQMRQPPGRQHHFQIRHDIFLPDRPENRLLKTALDIVCKTTQDPSNWRLSHELRSMLLEVSPSRDTIADFKQWRNDRLMAHYQPVKPWCELIIQQQTPLAILGEWKGMSLLFPMEKLFERYVAACLRDSLPSDATLDIEVKNEYLCEHKGRKVFQLRPDLMITQGDKRWVLDTKWKCLDTGPGVKNYGLSQEDFYQLFAYGHKYLGGQGDLVLIYPKREGFQEELAKFEYSAGMKLYVVPFDLNAGVLCGFLRLSF